MIVSVVRVSRKIVFVVRVLREIANARIGATSIP